MEKNIEVMNFVNDRYNINKNNPVKKSNNKLKLYYSIVGLTVGIVLVSAMKYENKPIRIAAQEVMKDNRMFATNDIGPILGSMTDDELLEYIKNNNITKEQLENEIKKIAKQQKIDSELAIDKTQDDIEELYGKTI